MSLRIALAAVFAVFAGAPCAPARAAQSAAPKIPATGPGQTWGLDPYVEAFQKEWHAIDAAIIQVGQDLKAIQVPTDSAAGDVAAKAAIIAKYGEMGALMARAETAHKKMLDHIMGDTEGPLKFGPAPKAAPQAARADASADGAALHPYDDPTLRRSFTAPKAVPHPTLQAMNSPSSYNSYGGGVGSGFNGSMGSTGPGFNANAPRATAYNSGASPAWPTSDGSTVGDAPSTIGAGGSAQGGAGMGAGAAGSGAAVGSTRGDNPAVNPAADTLSKNTSNVAEEAEKRMEAAQQAAQQRAQDQQQQAQQQQQEQMQMAMQGATMAATLGAQLAQNKNQQQPPQGGGGGGGGGATSALQQQLTSQQQQLDALQNSLQQLTGDANNTTQTGNDSLTQANTDEQMNNDQRVAQGQPPVTDPNAATTTL